MKDNRIFVDTNIFIYAIMEEKLQVDKRIKAISLLRNLATNVIYINTQVIHEIYSVMLRHGIDDKAIQDKLTVIIQETKIAIINLETISKCWDMRLNYKYSYWDSLILASAFENNCAVVYSEDMQHNQLIENSLRIINPFLD
jgi:predicted nucleic acid-binding protein